MPRLDRLAALGMRGRHLSEQLRAATALPPAQLVPARMAAAGRRAAVYVHGEIGGWWDGIDPDAFIRDVHALDVDDIDLHINSPGGSVFDATAMYTAVLDHPARVTAHINGIAASAAAFLAMAADEVEIAKPARMMIHDASGLAYGPPAVMQEMHDLLDGLSDTVAEIHADRAGGTTRQWRERMRETTWFTARAAVDAGLADRITADRAAEDDAPVESLRSQLVRARARARFEKRG